MGIGIGSGENRAEIAAKQAISSPSLEVKIDGAKGHCGPAHLRD